MDQQRARRSSVRAFPDKDALRTVAAPSRRPRLDIKVRPAVTSAWDEAIEAFHARKLVLNAQAWDVENCKVFPPSMVVVDEQSQILRQSVRKSSLLANIPELAVMSQADLDQLFLGKRDVELRAEVVRHVEQPSVLLGSAQGFNYYHWMAEMLPKLDLIREDLREGRQLVVPKLASRFHVESLTYFGVNPEECLVVKKPTSFKNLRIISNIAQSNTRLASFIDSFYAPHAGAGGGKLYLSRSDAKTRRVLNEQELESSLAARGFTSVRGGGLSFEQQVRLFGGASLVVGPHGAGLANIVFMPTGSRLVELLPDSFDQGVTSYAALCEERGLDYTMLLCPSNGAGANADLEVPVDDILRVLNAVG